MTDPSLEMLSVFFVEALRQTLTTGRCDVHMERGTQYLMLSLYADAATEESTMEILLPNSYLNKVEDYFMKPCEEGEVVDGGMAQP